MDSIQINTSSQSYPIYIDGSFDHLYTSIMNIGKDYSQFVILTDSHVGPLYGETIQTILKQSHKPVKLISFEAGEGRKHLETITMVVNKMIDGSADRKTLMVALGGGVTGDMAGFSAAIYMRGIDFIQIPTTLLSQVDSSVGGKTGVDFNGYKNIIGAFYQPKLVYINTSVLNTLPKQQFIAGMAEVLKYGFIKDSVFYDYLKTHQEAILSLDTATLTHIIKQSCLIKKAIVDEDEREMGNRALLSFGHTFGHAIERLSQFSLVHGECVAIGMVGALRLSASLGTLEPSIAQQGIELIQSYGLPSAANQMTVDEIYEDMFKDKKTSGKRLVFACLNEIGDSYLTKETLSYEQLKPIIHTLITQ